MIFSEMNWLDRILFLKRIKAESGIEKTVTGNPIHITDALAAKVKSLSVALEPIQSGTGDPSPDNVRPISGRTGVNVTRTGFNVWDEEWELGALYWATGLPYFSNSRIRSKYFTCLPSTTYCWSCNSGPINMTMFEYDSEQNMLSRVVASEIRQVSTFTTSDKAVYLRFYLQENYGTTYNHDICINFSDPAKNGTYESGQVVTTPISWQSEAGIVYGGMLDVTQGVLTVTMAEVDLGTLNWIYNSTRQFMEAIVADGKRKTSGVDAVCSKYTHFTGGYSVFIQSDKCFVIGLSVYSSDCKMLVRDTSYSDAATFKAVMSGVQLVYELAQPVTIQLTPEQLTTLLGTNNIWSDGNNITMTYKARKDA